jgi:DNA-binding IclR family transcriptional regulator
MTTYDPSHGGKIKSDETLLAIIEGLQELDRAGVTELSTYLELTKSTVHKHLKTMEEHGYVVNMDGTYRLSFRFLTLGGVVRNSNRLCTAAYEPVREVAEVTDTITTFAICEHNRGYFTYQLNNKYDMNVVNIGSVFFLHQNAAGKAMLAEFPDDTVELIVTECGLPARTENTITDQDALFEEIERIRDQGFAMSVAERVEGVQSLSAAIEDPETGEFGAISISTPATRATGSQIGDKYAEEIMDRATEIELNLRYQ